MTQTPITVVLKSDETDNNGDDRVSFFFREEEITELDMNNPISGK